MTAKWTLAIWNVSVFAAVALVLAACGDDGGGSGGDLGSLDDLYGDAPPAALVGSWQAYDSSDPLFQYYNPATGEWSGNGLYSEIHVDGKGAYEEVDILQTGAGSGCPSALYLHFQGTLRLDGGVITFERVRGRSVAEDCRGRSVRTDNFVDGTFSWAIDDDVLALGAVEDPTDALLYGRME